MVSVMIQSALNHYNASRNQLWLRIEAVFYARTVRPLQELLDKALQGSQRIKQAAAGIKIDFRDEERTSFEAVKNYCHSQQYPTKQLYLLTDMSDSGWGLVITQVKTWRPDTPIQHQSHELLICMGGSRDQSYIGVS
ncbi:Hypothetical protein PHPALM_17524 [Phytophthora palmivora]|uniref:Uncharacterized protein n=1 Tax=Phytophthora palmivora TaxID=4796 RepID=A0A2P4XM10_9STRA|nr:Hypothetical protein PHPALM_17524 [Phytophthora palmivora]